jgi:hypothetical protein
MSSSQQVQAMLTLEKIGAQADVGESSPGAPWDLLLQIHTWEDELNSLGFRSHKYK